MCFGLGLGCCVAVIEFFSYIGLVTVPIFGSFYGIETVLRLSILLIIHSLLAECFPQILFRIVPFLNLIMFIGLMNLPISLIPWPMIWLYDKVIWLAEPVLMIAEVVLLQNFVMRCSQYAADEIEREGDSIYLYKGGILLFSSLCYAVTASLAYEIFSSAAPSQVLCLFIVLLLLVALHNMMLMAHEGIISDCAFCSLISVTILYIMVVETKEISSPLAEPLLWTQTSESQSSVINIIGSIITMSSTKAQRSIEFLKRFVTPLFLGLLAIRLYGILFIISRATRNFFLDLNVSSEDIDYEDSEEVALSPLKSPLLLKVSVIFMLTQFTSGFLEEWSGQVRLPWLVVKFPPEVLIGRIVQIVSVNAFYMWRLYWAEDWTWNLWLT
ncbi:unnamed protein product [Candidula unifasciata]|uniref:Uncharacterized protein n=1 Tax=Candidula unifasciata TaxID=100452 RepID=A0A8S3ZD58_9EUPU|nr:unnamed protein product [Candidula unifasciata]